MKTEDFSYDLPERLIAAEPAARREDSRMLIVDVARGCWRHGFFRDFPKYVGEQDLVVLNNSKVIKARLPMREPRGEVLLIEPAGPDGVQEAKRWWAMVRPGRKWREGMEWDVAGTRARVVGMRESGERLLEFAAPPDFQRHGEMPLPPYLGREALPGDDERYQTVFARHEGSVAAPTAGLHFSPEILAELPHAFVTLHVGPGTFQPVKSEDPRDHIMHEERYSLPAETVTAMENARRVFAVGTTVTRVLESQPPGPLKPGNGRTSIFIHPPYTFRRIDGLLTNFHLPRSTLLMLISALAGRELILEAYAEAVREEYRFFSYGDCMLLLRPRFPSPAPSPAEI